MGETFFRYANFHSRDDLHLLVRDVERDIVGELEAQTIEIPARRGIVYEGSKIGEKKISVSVVLKAFDERERIDRAKSVAQLVEATADRELYPLTFTDEPGMTYWCYVSEISNPERVIERGADTTFNIVFTVPEGVAYGERISRVITTPVVEMTPIGTAPTNPILTFTAGETVGKVGIATEYDFVYFGSETEGEETGESKRVLNDTCNSMATWTQATQATFPIENGIVTDAKFVSTGDAIQPEKKNGRFYYGTSTNKKVWQGGHYSQGLPTTLKDWKITARFYIDNRYARSRSKIELYLLSSNGSRIGRFMIKDNGIDLQNYILVEIGADNSNKDVFLSTRDSHKITKSAKTTTKTITVSDTRKTTDKKAGYKKGDTYSRKLSVQENLTENFFTDFYGSITLTKKGNQYVAEVQRMEKGGIPTGAPVKTTYTDTTNKYTSMMEKFSMFGLYIANMPIDEDLGTTAATYKQNVVQLTDLRVWNLNAAGVDPAEILEAGDELIFDLENGKVYKNGEPAKFAIGSEFFSVPPGQTTNIGLLPPPGNGNTWTLDYIPRYL